MLRRKNLLTIQVEWSLLPPMVCWGSSARKDGCAVPILLCAAVAANRVIYDIQLEEDVVTRTPRRIGEAPSSLHADEPQHTIRADNAGLGRILHTDFENKSRISSTVPGRQFSTVTTFGGSEAPSSPSGVGIAA